ncbi:dephospho-CoA kinase [Fodinibius roseus]|uniref:Dephospho-CoA kinase n=1 Tax=Fodinibius roseus TaxID=1194090 RepID=A0A1M4T991_9BACT|nr:dephospho-CoA kinase [Fodinibius roseus]SHE40980.1 dephospho-CoA kinase [Fodinibius roseus]
MVTVGITGGIGSGKSAVCEVWTRMGGYVLNADDLAKELMVRDADIRRQLVETFGECTFRGDGSLNRAYLAEEAFQKGRVGELNAIVHPKLPDAVKQRMQAAAHKGFRVGIYEAALLLESDHLGFFDHVVLVLADEEKRLEWVRERDNASRRDIKSRMDKQRNFDNATHRADIVIRNEGTLEELKEKAKRVFNTFLDT